MTLDQYGLRMNLSKTIRQIACEEPEQLQVSCEPMSLQANKNQTRMTVYRLPSRYAMQDHKTGAIAVGVCFRG